MQKILYSYAEAATLLGLSSTQALRDLVYKGLGPVCTRVGRRAFFLHEDLIEWARSHREAKSSDRETKLDASTTSAKRGRPTVAQRQARQRRK